MDFLTPVKYHRPRAPVVQAPSILDQSKARPAGEFEVSDVPDYRALRRISELPVFRFQLPQGCRRIEDLEDQVEDRWTTGRT